MPMAPRAATMSAFAPASSKLSLVKKVAVGPLAPSLLLTASRCQIISSILKSLTTSAALQGMCFLLCCLSAQSGAQGRGT